MAAYYNEIDPAAAARLRESIRRGLIPAGEVDERDIRDVAPSELVRFTQCHFFAGIGIWPLALRRAGWPDARQIWTGSCPCQPFSSAGTGAGFDDERHLWPAWHWLIEQRRPPVVAGEQVASKDGLGWLDLVSADLAGIGYAGRAFDLCAAGFGLGWRGSAYAERLERALRGCPDPLVARQLGAFADWADHALAIGGLHLRQRLYFAAVDDALGERWTEGRGLGDHREHDGPEPRAAREDGSMAEPASPRCEGRQKPRGDRASAGEFEALDLGRASGDGQLARDSAARLLGDSGRVGCDQARGREPSGQEGSRLENRNVAVRSGGALGMGDAQHEGLEGLARHGDHEDQSGRLGGPRAERPVGEASVPDRLAESGGQGGLQERADPRGGGGRGRAQELGERAGGGGPLDPADPGERGRLDIDWLLCRDGVWRPVEAGSFPLADATSGRAAELKQIGNGLDFETVTEFCRALMGALDEP